MGRKKTYDRDVLIAKATELFRDHGYAGTSTQMLVEALGVNRYSLYAEFGSKEALFDAALALYDTEVIGRSFGPLERPEAGISEIRALLEFFGATDSPGRGRGCLLCNAAVEFGPEDPSGSGFVRRYFERLSAAFVNALRNGQSRCEIAASVDVDQEACFLTTCVLGLFVMLRAEAPHDTIAGAAQAAMDHLEQLATGS